MRKFTGLVGIIVVLVSASAAFAASDQEKLRARLDASRNVIDEIMATPDKAIPDSIARQAVRQAG